MFVCVCVCVRPHETSESAHRTSLQITQFHVCTIETLFELNELKNAVSTCLYSSCGRGHSFSGRLFCLFSCSSSLFAFRMHQLKRWTSATRCITGDLFVGHELHGIPFSTCTIYGVWQVIFGIRKNAKYFIGKQDLTATREAGFTNIWTGDAGFLAFRREFEKSSRTKMYFLVGKADQPVEPFQWCLQAKQKKEWPGQCLSSCSLFQAPR